MHTHAYYDWVLGKLEAVESQGSEAVAKALGEIRETLIGGKTPWGCASP